MSTTQRKEILQRVKEGKLTIDEALILLEAEEENPSNTVEKPLKQESSAEKQPQPEQEYGLSTNVHLVDDDETGNKTDKESIRKAKWSDFIGGAIDKIRRADLDLNFGHFEEVHHTYLFQDAHVKKADLYLYNGDIEIVAADVPEIRLECYAKVYQVEYKEQAKRHFLQKAFTEFNDETFKFRLEEKTIKAECKLVIPFQQMEQFDCEMFNGSFNGNGMVSKRGELKNTNGSITLESVRMEELEVETVNGHVHVEGSVNEAELETVNGTILSRGIFRKLTASSFHGSVSAALDSDAELLKLNTTSGSIDVRLPENTNVHGQLASTFGDLKVTLPDVRVTKDVREVVKKRYVFEKGDVDSPMLLVATAKTGGITVHMKDKERYM
ncbi:DUF4097 family beta strand repeat protein [Bacillaceae bacterium SIJ1]|uniref:DUF4097 family beta strand repeat-containing protein n=1 Tax=Litoribacterium kuwaitense TaxID=1398745 RepID=UPI0013EC77F9|nr:DUF4097 family beta strand repeat-containing protein [Litoribacterium kuwaitense]NGP45345.1 DUF4097 family beta strand repeat protein [Litoribacterium kuwaitense]